MKALQKLAFPPFLFAIGSIPAAAGVVVNSPANGADVSSPFNLSASAATCSSQPVSAMGYSLDSSPDTTTVNEQVLDVNVQSATGGHTVHVKAWGDKGAVCVSDVAVNVTAGASLVPSGATSVGAVQMLGNWQEYHDPGTPGWSSGAMSLVGSPSMGGTARKFYTTFGNNGGERYHAAFSDDAAAANFVYDAWVYLTNDAGSIANVEMDLYQVMPNGQTVLFGFQCDGWSGTWDYNANWTGPTKPTNTWMHSGSPCNVRTWGRNQWHHVQISYSRTDYGVVTYHSVTLDGKKMAINATAPSAYALGWAPVLLTNLQIDGLGSGGSNTVYLDNLVIYRW